MTLAILDKGVVSEVFGGNRPEAGRKFIEWVDNGAGTLTAGGANLEELRDHKAFRSWAVLALRYNNLQLVDDQAVRRETERLDRAKSCKSNDTHVIALARVGGARLLYANDKALQDDFNDPALITRPRGKVYSTHVRKRFTRTHRDLLNRGDLRGNPQIRV